MTFWTTVNWLPSVLRVYHKFPKPGVSLQGTLDPKVPRAAEGDSLRYRQIVQNLTSNAIKFTEKGYVHVAVSLEHEDEESFDVLTEVMDSGIGVPSAVCSALFTPFMQFDNSTTKKFQGTGLGLSICKSLAELMNGQIGYKPNPEGAGSLFWFTAKLKKVPQESSIQALETQLETLNRPSIPSSPLEAIKKAAVNKHILLAEDNTINRTVMLKMLAGLGFPSIDVAVDGEEAVKLATATQDSTTRSSPYDLILMDISMPLLDGVEATRKIRNAGLQMPIIAMTANALKGHAENYIAKGMTGYVAKPVDRNVLINLLLGYMQQREQGD
ncbi:unnamed protein product [Periconia digitata]|uniref:Uncharacterized protein n=1 Tax=Periconia digitata TaxID=1303443 RepID=A0A9W4XUF4_9PLEO|nr:unnamed protein product [Periconia digitata]